MKYCALLVLLTLWTPLAHADAPPSLPNFRLIDHAGRVQELYRQDAAEHVVLIALDTADAATLDTLVSLRKKLKALDRPVWLICTGATSRAQLAEIAARFKDALPVLDDAAGSVSRACGFSRSGETLIVMPKDKWAIAARLGDPAPLAEGIKAALNHAPSQGHGPALATADTTQILYSRDIAPILAARCVSCHSEGGIGPFAMSSHKKVAGWADMMQETLLTRQMPPWHADPAHGHFQNSLALSVDEERTLMAWLAAGAPKGDTEPDPLADNPAPAHGDWTLGTPNLVVQMTDPVAIPATGVVEYQYQYVPSTLTEDRWVRAIEMRPTNRQVVHHALVFVIYPEQYAHLQPKMERGLNGFFASYLPGAKLEPFPEGTAQFLPAGSMFVFQMHYNTTGKAETDRSELALYFTDAPPREALRIEAISEEDFEISPQDPDYPIEAEERFMTPVTLWGMLPHMHYRGSRFRFEQVNGKTSTTLLNVPWYQFDWQPMYMLDGPVQLPSGTRVRCIGAFDNSKYNARNPDPKQSVEFGEQSFDEMFIGYMMYSEPLDPAKFQPRANAAPQFTEPITAEMLPGTEWDVGDGMTMKVKEDGIIKVLWFSGTWRMEGGKVIFFLDGEEFIGDIMGNGLYLEGEKLTRLK